MYVFERYTDKERSSWDMFVRESRNGTFLFQRSYMEYHRERFPDCSLLCFDEKHRLVALLPAHRGTTCDTEFCSHGGLTYGGLILSGHTGQADVLRLMTELVEYLRKEGFTRMLYKAVPHIYHHQPSEDDLYALFRLNARLAACNVSTAVPLFADSGRTLERRRRRGCERAEQNGYEIKEAGLELFWPIMQDNLMKRYSAVPVHTLEEMKYLQGLFPTEICCYLVMDGGGRPQAGAVVYDAGRVLHVQYGHATEEGKRQGALDLLYIRLIEKYGRQSRIHYFDFGTSNEQQGRYLNENLIMQKEGFGGHAVVYNTFVLEL